MAFFVVSHICGLDLIFLFPHYVPIKKIIWEREREGFVALGAFDLQHKESNIRYNCDSLSLSLQTSFLILKVHCEVDWPSWNFRNG